MAKSYRKYLVGATTAAVVGASFAGVAGAASSYNDVNSKYQSAVDFVVSKGIVGTSDTTFGTYENIKRVDAAVFVAKVLGLNTTSAPAAGFTDVPERAKGAVNALKAAGITSGKSATEFGAQDYITRGELAVWITKGFKLQAGHEALAFNDVAPKYADAVNALVSNEVTSGTSASTFGTYDNAKRGDFAIFLDRADKASKKDPGVTKKPVLKIEGDNKGNKLVNGATKTYTVTFTNPVSGKPIENATLNVTFKENLNTDFKPQNNVWVTNGYEHLIPYQSVDGQEDEVEIRTDKFGKATFTVSGTNATATPIVFLDGSNQYWDANAGHLPFQEYADDRFDKETEYYAEAAPVTFGVTEYKIDVEGLGDNYAAVATSNAATKDEHNGREYKITVTKPDGTPFAGGSVNVGVYEKLDGVLGTTTSAYVVDKDGKPLTNGLVKLDSKGQAKVILASEVVNDSAEPIVWIDQNEGANFQSGVLEKGEPVSDHSKVAPTNFQPALVDVSAKFEVEDTKIEGEKEFKYTLLNQSGKAFQPSDEINALVTFEVKNTGTHIINVDGVNIAPDGTATFTKNTGGNTVSVIAKTDKTGKSSVQVTASASLDFDVNNESDNVFVNPVTKSSDLAHSYVAVVTGVEKLDKGNEIVLTFDKEVFDYELTDFRINTATGYENPTAISKDAEDEEELTLKFSSDVVNATTQTTLKYDGNYGGTKVLVDEFSNEVKAFTLVEDAAGKYTVAP